MFQKEQNIYVIPTNIEKYMALMLDDLVFIDSFQFMSSNFKKLVNTLPNDKFQNTSEVFRADELEIIKQKGVYPYESMDSFQKFEESEFRSKDNIDNQINDEGISEDTYKHAQSVWSKFKCLNLGDYHDLCLKSDIVLLANVFENFRRTCMDYYKLDRRHYFTSPGLSWDAMLKMTSSELELISHIDQYLFIEKGLQDGMNYIANRYCKANNNYIKNMMTASQQRLRLGNESAPTGWKF